MGIPFRTVDSTLNVLGDTQNPKVAWGFLERRIGAKQEGLQSALIEKHQLASQDGTESIYTHWNYIFDQRVQLANTGKLLSGRFLLLVCRQVPSISSSPYTKTLLTTLISYVTNPPSTRCGRSCARQDLGTLKQQQTGLSCYSVSRRRTRRTRRRRTKSVT